MTDRDDTRTDPDHARPTTLTVPGRDHEDLALSDEDLQEELQRAQDLGSASRSCVAIIAVMLVIALLICVFLTWAFFLQ